MDILAGLPSAAVLRLQPGQPYSLARHTLLLEGALVPQPSSGRGGGGLQGGTEVPAPAVLPCLVGQRRLFSFYAGPVAPLAGRPAGQAYVAGPEGAVLVVAEGPALS